MKALQNNAVTLTAITVQDLTDRTKPVGTWSGSLAGTRTGSTWTPASMSVVVAKSIAVRYRGGHPRTYFLLGADGDFAGPGTWTAGFTGAVATGYNAYITAIKAAGSGCTIVTESAISYYHGGSWSGGHWHPTLRTPPVVNDVQGITVRSRIGSQRRRLKKA
jgi:hypothetical protein